MRKTAEFGRGTFTYVGNLAEVKDKLDTLFKKLERPVLNDIQLDRTGWAGWSTILRILPISTKGNRLSWLSKPRRSRTKPSFADRWAHNLGRYPYR